jgi:hypothetical protein
MSPHSVRNSKASQFPILSALFVTKKVALSAFLAYGKGRSGRVRASPSVTV